MVMRKRRPHGKRVHVQYKIPAKVQNDIMNTQLRKYGDLLKKPPIVNPIIIVGFLSGKPNKSVIRLSNCFQNAISSFSVKPK